jgi:hypothetical protein
VDFIVHKTGCQNTNADIGAEIRGAHACNAIVSTVQRQMTRTDLKSAPFELPFLMPITDSPTPGAD